MFGRVWREWHGTRARAPSSLLVVVVAAVVVDVGLPASLVVAHSDHRPRPPLLLPRLRSFLSLSLKLLLGLLCVSLMLT